jgi:ankyrin repeat protein
MNPIQKTTHHIKCLFEFRGALHGRVPLQASGFFSILTMMLALSISAFCGEIHEAAQWEDLAKVQALLRDNPKLVFSKDRIGFTPLHWSAVTGRRKDVAELLLACKADVNARMNKGDTPLHIAAANDNKVVAESLLAARADVDAKDDEGDTPLHVAASMGSKDVAELLLARKADVNARNRESVTPLFLALAERHKDLALLLRRHGGHK